MTTSPPVPDSDVERYVQLDALLRRRIAFVLERFAALDPIILNPLDRNTALSEIEITGETVYVTNRDGGLLGFPRAVLWATDQEITVAAEKLASAYREEQAQRARDMAERERANERRHYEYLKRKFEGTNVQES